MAEYALAPMETEQEAKELDDLVREVFKGRYDHKAPVPDKPEYLITVGGKGIALPASLIGVYGPPKSRKSSFMAMIAAACLSPDNKFGHIESNIKGDILWFDTEQNETEVKYFQDNVVKMSGAKDDDYIYGRYFSMKLRPYDELKRLAIIDRMITAPDIFDNVGLIVLDGVADLMYNVNEIETSKKLVTRLTFWADKLQVPLIVALHTNKDGKDATGSLGGFLNKKASYTIKCEPDYEGGPSTIKPYYTRNGQTFLPFVIDNHEETGMPQFYEGESKFGDFSSEAMMSRSKVDKMVNDVDGEDEPEMHEAEQQVVPGYRDREIEVEEYEPMDFLDKK